uniref:Secreted protein n=1 Tax=Peronospora matthiolae TaxID=2874970 RepID=A0AAV1UGW5_9STRA
MGKKMCRQARFSCAATCLLLTSAESTDGAEIEVKRNELGVRRCESSTPRFFVAA